ncbi:helix-turn-helix domain-containing protein, partial [bacterium]|nr:helix-turn-helix domain-containing protein [bacterium]MBU1025403.1 helix-turn-helix domain-containing protein [bacterium]
MSLGDRVKEHRKNLGMTQMDLANASDITQATISRLESGEMLELKSEALKRLASALGVTVDYLIGKTDKLTPDDIVRSDSKAEHLLKG